MTDKYIRDKITELRIRKGISEYKMSLDMGHSRSYMQNISAGRALPSLTEFLYMCEYLGVTPKDFFDEEQSYPILVRKIIDSIKDMKDKDLLLLISLIDRLKEK